MVQLAARACLCCACVLAAWGLQPRTLELYASAPEPLVWGPPQGKEAVTFERFMAFRKSGGNHCHVNVVPASAAAASQARGVRSDHDACSVPAGSPAGELLLSLAWP